MIVGELPAHDREVIMLRYEKDFSLSEIGKVIGVTESRACQILSRAMGWLRGRLLEISASR